MKKIGFVIPWYSENIPGGAEMELRGLTTHLHESGVEVEILTTCVKEFSADWNRNHFKKGIEKVHGFTLRRFKVRKGDTAAFDAVNYKIMNGLPLTGDTADRINLFDYENLDAFYARFQQQMDAMAEDGAEAVILFIHWGEEYQLTPNRYQKAIAQALCDLGVDVIIGNHPHVVQSLELLTASNDPNHRTICLYSTGNALSNQREGSVSALKTAHIEDGVLFSVTFARYSDGSVVLEDVDALPFWVYRKGSGSSRQFYILPLDPETRDSWQSLYHLSKDTMASAVESWQRTMNQLNADLEELRSCLRQSGSRQHGEPVVFDSDKKQKQE